MKKKTLDKRVEGLKAHTAEKKAETEEKISRAIDQMKREGKKISFSSVAEKAGVSRTTLYAHERIKERIRGLAVLSSEDRQAEKDMSRSGKTELLDRIKKLKEQIKKLEADKEKLIIQLMDHYELKRENERLRRQTEKKQDRESPAQEENGYDNGRGTDQGT